MEAPYSHPVVPLRKLTRRYFRVFCFSLFSCSVVPSPQVAVTRVAQSIVRNDPDDTVSYHAQRAQGKFLFGKR